jgi:hypothetical protein
VTKVLSSLLVGAFFRPPAKAIMEHAPANAKLELVPEPENPYDALAIRVLFNLTQVPESQHEALRLKLPGTGHDWDELVGSGESLFVGYVCTEHNKDLFKARQVLLQQGQIAEAEALVGNETIGAACRDLGDPPWQAKLGFSAEGKPMVKLEVPAPAEEDPDEEDLDEHAE